MTFMSKQPGISVIIPTYNREILLAKTLDSLCLQTLGNNYYEVIVIDDGSTDSTLEVVNKYLELLNITYFYQEHCGFRVAKARNVGISSANYSVCLFLDSGVLAATDLLETHLNAHMSAGSDIAYVGYAYAFAEFDKIQLTNNLDFNSYDELNTLFSEVSAIDSYKDTRYFGLQKLGLTFSDLKTPWLLFWTCHASCSTYALLKVNGFDEHFESWGGEDIELALRLYKNNVHIALLQTAQTIHCPHERTVDENKKSSYENCQYIYRKHPAPATFLLAQKNQRWEDIVESLHFVGVSLEHP